MKKYIFSIFCIFALSLQAISQNTWSLNQCIEYAITHNIDIKQKNLNIESRKIEQNTAKNAWLPSLNAGLSENFGFGKSPSGNNTLVSSNSSSTGFNVNLSMPIFDGLSIKNRASASKYSMLAAVESLNIAKENLEINVTSYYLQVLINQELLHVALMERTLTQQQFEKTSIMVSEGKVATSQLYDMRSQMAQNDVTITQAENDLALSKLTLIQSLELDNEIASFNVISPDSTYTLADCKNSLQVPDEIYNNAIRIKPHIKEQELILNSSKHLLKVAQAEYYPKLNFSASYSNGYYHYSGNSSTTNPSFKTQLDQNSQSSLGFSLSIPIFNRFTTRNSVRNSKIDIANQELAMENTKKSLYKEIQQAYYNATASLKKYNATDDAVKASAEAYRYTVERYDAGKSTTFDLNEARTKYIKSLSEQTQAKYDFIFRSKILDFYNGTPISL